jgi:hypothetical protein
MCKEFHHFAEGLNRIASSRIWEEELSDSIWKIIMSQKIWKDLESKEGKCGVRENKTFANRKRRKKDLQQNEKHASKRRIQFRHCRMSSRSSNSISRSGLRLSVRQIWIPRSWKFVCSNPKFCNVVFYQNWISRRKFLKQEFNLKSLQFLFHLMYASCCVDKQLDIWEFGHWISIRSRVLGFRV